MRKRVRAKEKKKNLSRHWFVSVALYSGALFEMGCELRFYNQVGRPTTVHTARFVSVNRQVVLFAGAIVCVAQRPFVVDRLSARFAHGRFLALDSHEPDEVMVSPRLCTVSYARIGPRIEHMTLHEREAKMPEYGSVLHTLQSQPSPYNAAWGLEARLTLHSIPVDRLWYTTLGAFIRATYVAPLSSFGRFDRRDWVDRVFLVEDAMLVPMDPQELVCAACGCLRIASFVLLERPLGSECAGKWRRILHVKEILTEFRQNPFDPDQQVLQERLRDVDVF